MNNKGIKLRKNNLLESWRRQGPPQRIGGTNESPRLAKANAKRDRRRAPAGFVKINTEPKPLGEKIVRRLNSLTMAGLCRFTRRSARRASTAKHSAARAHGGPFEEHFLREQNRQIAFLRAGMRMIEHRVKLNIVGQPEVNP